MLSNSSKPFRNAVKNSTALGQFNIMNLETWQAVIDASIKTKSFVFIGCTKKTIDYMGLDNIISLSKSIPKKARIILHLDCGDEKTCNECIKKGFTSVMFDGSMFSFEKNIRITKRIVQSAYKKNVSVEARLGKTGWDEQEESMTNPEKAKIFAEKTGCSSLCVNIGSCSAMPVIDFKRLKNIKELVKIPLVLHEANNIPSIEIRLAIKEGIRKINTSTETRWSFAKAVHEYVNTHGLLKNNIDSYDLKSMFGKGRKAMYKLIVKKIRLFHE